MRTNFAPDRLELPHMAQVEHNLRACVHCGICTASCPTYLLTGDERDSPRGRIILIKEMLEEGTAPGAETVHHLDRCLSCLACRSACPSGVDYRQLIDEARSHINSTYRRSRAEQLLRRLILETLSRPQLFRSAARLARVARPFARGLPGRLGDLVTKGARALPPRAPLCEPETVEREVALLPGCVQAALAPDIDAATARVLSRRGIRLVPLKSAGCCGALAHHLGERAAAKASATAVLAAFAAAGGRERFGEVLITATGCAAHLASYAELFAKSDPLFAAAEAMAGRIADLTQLVRPLPGVAPKALRVALHRPCSQSHGLRWRSDAASLLRGLGHRVVDLAEADLCCGSAGSYSLLQPELATKLRTRKRAHILQSAVQVVVSSNIGCIDQLADPAGPSVLHWIELLDWSEGGPVPAGLRALLAA
jgi:glycolate oxidase iron-sulfur subunit